jgi:hypothetical protein
MWVCLNNAFISAVEDYNDPTILKIRARKRSHLSVLFPKARIHESTDFKTDYRFRVFVSKEDFAQLVYEKAMAIDYGNFKNSVADDQLHDLYADFWTLHRGYQTRCQAQETRSAGKKKQGKKAPAPKRGQDIDRTLPGLPEPRY